MTSSGDWLEIAAGVLLIAMSAIVGYYVVSRLRAQRERLAADLASSPVFADDRAYNQIRLARGELAVLQREGRAVPRAAELLDQADAALQRHENVSAVRLARDAHKLLVETRQTGIAPSRTGSAPDPLLSRGPARTSDPVDAAPGPFAARPTLDGGAPAGDADPPGGAVRPAQAPAAPPKNRMEAHFQMTLLVGEIIAHPSAPGRPEAESLRGQAERAYAATEYTEALRLALRGRRTLGMRLETLPPGRASAPVAAAPGADAPSGDRTCPRCGRPVPPDDRFCRACGASMGDSQCPRCRAELSAADTFCGRCGAPVS